MSAYILRVVPLDSIAFVILIPDSDGLTLGRLLGYGGRVVSNSQSNGFNSDLPVM